MGLGCAKIHNFSLYIPNTKKKPNTLKMRGNLYVFFFISLLGFFFWEILENIYSEIAEKDAENTEERWKRNWFGKMEKFLNVFIFFFLVLLVNPLDPIYLNPYALCCSTRLHFSVHIEEKKESTFNWTINFNFLCYTTNALLFINLYVCYRIQLWMEMVMVATFNRLSWQKPSSH